MGVPKYWKKFFNEALTGVHNNPDVKDKKIKKEKRDFDRK